MRAGSLDRVIYIGRDPNDGRIFSTDQYGVPRRPNPQGTMMRAELVENAAADQTQESGEITDIILTFRLRYLAHVSPGDRLTYEGRRYEIVKVSEIGRRKGLEIIAKEKP